MNNLWENTSEQANCLICNNDAPFFMPLQRSDLVALRFQVPYQNVINNGGGMPIGSNVSLSIVNEAGTSICTLGTANLGKFILGVVNDGTNYIGEYQIYAPIPFADDLGIYTSQYYINVAVGDIVVISDIDVNFIYGVDQLPSNLLELKAGRIIRAGNPLTIDITDQAYLNGVLTPQNLLFSSTSMTCPYDDYDCFRYSLRVSYSNYGLVKIYYTKPFRIERCTESIRVSSKYPSNTIDCNGYKHQSSFNISSIVEPNRLLLRIPADLERQSNKIVKSYNSRCYNFKAEKVRNYGMKSDPMPEWMVDEVENLMMGQNLYVDNLELNLEDVNNIFQVSDINGQNYQNIDVNLQQCKCENVFVC